MSHTNPGEKKILHSEKCYGIDYVESICLFPQVSFCLCYSVVLQVGAIMIKMPSKLIVALQIQLTMESIEEEKDFSERFMGDLLLYEFSTIPWVYFS